MYFQKKFNLSYTYTILILLLLVLIIPGGKTYAESNQTVTSNSVINIREGPSLEEAIKDKMEAGISYVYIQKNGEWIEIQLPNGETGWVASYLVSLNNSSEELTSASISEDGLRLRKGPGTSYAVITILPKGMSVSIQSKQGDWIEITTSLGNGWVHADYIKQSNENSITATIEETSSSSLSSEEEKRTATVIKDNINVRSNPSTDSSVIGKLAKDTILHFTTTEGEWIKINFSGNTGWVHTSLISENSEIQPLTGKAISKTISIINNRTNIRNNASINASIIKVAGAGETFEAIEEAGDWYKIKLSDNEVGYVANWIVESNSTTESQVSSSSPEDLKGKVIVIDPGHGGKDSGTIGIKGTLEKNLTILTANLLAQKLEDAGSKVIFTRDNDRFISLINRVAISNFYHADAFISIHYDSISDSSVRGMTSYYYSSSQKELANELHASIIEATQMKDRGVRQNDYFVLRENNQPATLLELGYLSNQTEEQLVSTQQYQETVSTAIYEGLENYFE